MVEVVVKHRRTKIFGELQSKVLDALYEQLSYEVDGYRFSPAFRKHQWDGRKAFFRLETQTFPTGLLPLALAALKGEKVEHVVKDDRVFPDLIPLSQDRLSLRGIDLREDQKEALVVGSREHTGIFQLPTGWGKTEVICGLAKYLEPLPVLILVHSKTLLSQTLDRLEARLQEGTKIGVIGQGKFTPQRITVGMVQTLSRLLKVEGFKLWLQSVQVLIVDELHRHQAPVWGKVANFVSAPLRFGFSATADTLPDMFLHLQSITGPVIYKTTFADAAEAGLVVQPKISILQSPERSEEDHVEASLRAKMEAAELSSLMREGEVKVEPSLYSETYCDHIFLHSRRNDLIAGQAVHWAKNGKPVAVFVRLINHGRLLHKRIAKLMDGDEIAFLSGRDDVNWVKKKLRDFKHGLIRVIIVTSIFDEGVDIPNLEVLVLAGGGKSTLKTIQRVGRGCRVYEGKSQFQVIDFADVGHYIVAKHSLQRLADYRAQGWSVVLK